jgi:hypothetical protein
LKMSHADGSESLRPPAPSPLDGPPAAQAARAAWLACWDAWVAAWDARMAIDLPHHESPAADAAFRADMAAYNAEQAACMTLVHALAAAACAGDAVAAGHLESSRWCCWLTPCALGRHARMPSKCIMCDRPCPCRAPSSAA